MSRDRRLPMAIPPNHWHCAITQPLNDDLNHFDIAFDREELPTQAAARQRLVAPILTAHETLGADSPYGALARIAGTWMQQQEPYLLVPEVAVLAVCPCNGDHAAAEQAHEQEIMLRAATHGNPFTSPAPWTAPPFLN